MTFFSVFRVLGLILLAGVLSLPVLAAEKGLDEAAQKKSLILQFFEGKPPRALVDASIEAIAASRYAKENPAREEFISRMQMAVDYDRIETLTLKSMIEIYSVDELKAMVAYYGSEAGRSAEGKTVDLREKIAPELRQMLDQGLLNVVITPSPAESAQGPAR